jgi:hypothetical protein
MVQPAFASSYLETLQARAHQKNLAHHPYWHRLLHDRRNLLGVFQSEIDDPSFFLSPRGRKDPAAELDATLEAFFKPVPKNPEIQQAQCRYPARYAWLKEELSFDPAQLPEASCPRYDEWKGQMDPGSLSLVFASYYMNNPASAYGHTFLRLNAKRHTATERLLDYAVNFAADLEGDNGFLFAMKGLLGGYHGHFSTLPYYMKVQQYNNLESRDLWEYNLHVPPDHLERLLQHLWELGNTRLPYFFFNKNCSYYLLPVLDVMDPFLSASQTFVFKAIPIDTVRQVIRTPGMLEGVNYRPSHATKMIAGRKQLTPDEIRLAERAAANPGHITPAELSVFPPERQVIVLDSAYDLFRYQVGFKRDQPLSVQEKEKSLLLLRNQVGLPSPPLVISSASVTAPHLGHKTGRLDLAYGFSNRSHFEELSIRPALHSQDDPTQGYLPGSQLEMFHLKLRYDNDRKTAYVQDFSLVDLISITPWDRWIHPLSWKVKTGLAVADDLNRDPENSLYYGLNLGSGYAAWVPGTDEKLLVYGMAEMEAELGHAFDHDVRAGGGPTGGLLYSPCRYWRARFQMAHDEYAVGGTPSTTKLALQQSLSVTRDMECRIQLQRQNTYKEVLFSWVWFL